MWRSIAHRTAASSASARRRAFLEFGNGMSFSHSPGSIDEDEALEPEGYLRARAERAAQKAPVRVSIGDAAAAPLLHPASFDAAVASLVLARCRIRATHQLSCDSPAAATRARHAERDRSRRLRSEGVRRFDIGPASGITNPHVIGIARAPLGRDQMSPQQ
jgi:hypothetical protein